MFVSVWQLLSFTFGASILLKLVYRLSRQHQHPQLLPQPQQQQPRGRPRRLEPSDLPAEQPPDSESEPEDSHNQDNSHVAGRAGHAGHAHEQPKQPAAAAQAAAAEQSGASALEWLPCWALLATLVRLFLAALDAVEGIHSESRAPPSSSGAGARPSGYPTRRYTSRKSLSAALLEEPPAELA